MVNRHNNSGREVETIIPLFQLSSIPPVSEANILLYFVYKYFTFVTKMSRKIFSFEPKAPGVQDSHCGTFSEYDSYPRFASGSDRQNVSQMDTAG
jgi:hypothetical protein